MSWQPNSCKTGSKRHRVNRQKSRPKKKKKENKSGWGSRPRNTTREFLPTFSSVSSTERGVPCLFRHGLRSQEHWRDSFGRHLFENPQSSSTSPTRHNWISFGELSSFSSLHSLRRSLSTLSSLSCRINTPVHRRRRRVRR